MHPFLACLLEIIVSIECCLWNMEEATAGLQQKDWQDASGEVQDAPVQAAIQDGVVTFLHAADASQDLLKQDGTDPQTEQRSDAMIDTKGPVMEHRENLSPNATGSIDDASCLELE